MHFSQQLGPLRMGRLPAKTTVFNDDCAAAACELRKDLHDHMRKEADKMWEGVGEVDPEHQIRFLCLDPEQRDVALSRLWTKEMKTHEYCHHLEGSICDHIDSFGLIGVATLFCTPIIMHTQSNPIAENSAIAQDKDGGSDEMEKKAKINTCEWMGPVTIMKV